MITMTDSDTHHVRASVDRIASNDAVASNAVVHTQATRWSASGESPNDQHGDGGRR